MYQKEKEGVAPETEKTASKVEQYRKEFVGKVLLLMEQGKMFWQRPWNTNDIMPVNAVSKRSYQGCNVAYLLVASAEKGYGDPRWITYKQAQDNKYQVRKGEKGTRIEFWSKIEDDDFDTVESPEETNKGEERSRLYCKIYTVFNAEQVEGMPELERKGREEREFARRERGERIMNYCGVPIHYGGGMAFYRPREDKIYLPERGRFLDEAHFYATALHEIAHSTGHPSRLNREFGSDMRDAKYAREELRAEIASAFMQMELGFVLTEEGMNEHTQTHAAYIQSWLKHLKEDYKEFYRAIQDAVKIADYALAYDKKSKETAEVSCGEENRALQSATLACGALSEKATAKTPRASNAERRTPKHDNTKS
ncbi:hypothetical protein FACS1894204_11260 [Synergistales bacterium]|nr:hypothetical protein FACS1894204_11260 [Synergistales bacterium]